MLFSKAPSKAHAFISEIAKRAQKIPENTRKYQRKGVTHRQVGK